MSLLTHGVQPPPRDLQDEGAFSLWFNDVESNFPKVNSYFQTLTPTAVGANTTSEQTFTVAGLQTNSVIYVNKPSHQTGIIIGGVRVSASNTLAITFANITGGAITPTAEKYSIIEIRR